MTRLTGLTNQLKADYNLLDADEMDELLFSPYKRALGEETHERMETQVDNYLYYDGKQHRDESGNLVDADELLQPAELDYEPTRYATNYFKAIVDRKARWQMSGDHSIHVERKQIDDPMEKLEQGYEPTAEQETEDERARNLEELIEQLWRDNKMRTRLLQAARDRLIADRVVCKIIFDPRQGRLRWIWRPDYEFIPVYSDDDFEDLIGAYFLTPRLIEEDGEDVEAFKLQAYMLYDENEDGEEMAYLHEGIYKADDVSLVEELIPRSDDDENLDYEESVNIEGKNYMPLGLDFLPIVVVPVDELLGSVIGDGEISDLREQNDILNQMNEDAIDSIKFDMFSMTAVLNTSPGTADKMEIAPGAVLEARGAADGQIPEIKKIESGFRWKEAFKDQYMRVKGAMHEISGLPQVVPQEMNFGGMNSEAMRLLFHDIISDTEEHWLTWGDAFRELHEKSIKYLQERTGETNFVYDKEIVNSIENYETSVRFALPLPDNRKDLVDLLTVELGNKVESRAGAMERLGVDDIQKKMKEIDKETIEEQMGADIYGGEDFGDGDDEGDDAPPTGTPGVTERTTSNGEKEVLCDRCGGSGKVISQATGDQITCPKCSGSGWFQPRKR